MREQPHYLELLTEEFFKEYYVAKRMSFPDISEMLQKQGKNVAIGTVYKYAKKLGFGRSISEGKRNEDPNPLDYNISYLSENLIESIDGFLIGDGCIGLASNKDIHSARLRCGLEHEEFCRYFMNCFCEYRPTVDKYNSNKMKQGFVWCGSSKFHPDLYHQYMRWYPENSAGKRVKYPPQDVRITPKSVMMWYLGDGSVVCQNNTIVLRLSTDGFAPEGVEYLVARLMDKGIQCHKNGYNRIQIDAKGIPAFFDFIGRKSPVKCYDYKFDIPEWRFAAKRMSEVAEELGIDYTHLAYLVKVGKIGCYRATEKGKPRFLPEHIEEIKKHFGK